MKAYELLDSPEKWFGAGHDPEPGADQVCAVMAINRAYEDPEAAHIANRKLRKVINCGIINWNDRSDWRTVYETLKGLDI